MAVVYICSVDLGAILQVTTAAAQDGGGEGQANDLPSEPNKSSRHDVLSYQERRLTKLIYSDSDLHLQVRIKSTTCLHFWHCYISELYYNVVYNIIYNVTCHGCCLS